MTMHVQRSERGGTDTPANDVAHGERGNTLRPRRLTYIAWLAIEVALAFGIASSVMPGSVGLEVLGRAVASIIAWALISLLGCFPILLLAAFLMSERGRAQASAATDIRHHGWEGRFLDDVAEWYATVFDELRYPIPAMLSVLTFIAGWGFVIFHEGPGVLYDVACCGNLDSVIGAISSGPPVSFGFLGAYFFATWFLFKRYVAGDLGPGAFLHVSVRTWLVTIMTLVATVTVEGNPLFPSQGSTPTQVLAAIAFLGALTPTMLLQVIAGSIAGGLQAIFRRETSEVPLADLGGMNPWKAARLVEEGIDSVQNLAMEDPARLLVVTSEGGLRILDWVDQAILLNIAKKDLRRQLADQGIRTAVDLYLVFCSLGLVKSLSNVSGLAYEISLPSREAFGIEPARLRNMVITMVNHPNFEQIREMREQALRRAAVLFESPELGVRKRG